MTGDPTDVRELEAVAEDVSALFRALGNQRRLMIVCKLAEWGEANVTTLAQSVGLSPSALSQHLSKLRQRGIVSARRDSQTIWYRISDPRIDGLFASLHALFCRPRVVADDSKARTRKLRAEAS